MADYADILPRHNKYMVKIGRPIDGKFQYLKKNTVLLTKTNKQLHALWPVLQNSLKVLDIMNITLLSLYNTIVFATCFRPWTL
jgi:hypothetical protein